MTGAGLKPRRPPSGSGLRASSNPTWNAQATTQNAQARQIDDGRIHHGITIASILPRGTRIEFHNSRSYILSAARYPVLNAA